MSDEQRERAASRCVTHHICDCMDWRLTQAERRAERAEAERDALRAVLRKVEWLEFRAGSLDGPELYLCAACGQDRVNGHLSRCSVAKALDAARKEGEG